MHKLIRFYNQNRALVIAIIGIIALIIIMIQVMNSFAKEQKQKTLENITKDKNSSTNNQSTTILDGNKSALTGEEVKDSNSSKEQIKQFIKHCNEGKVEEAYNMITDECKERIYPSLERFKKSYYNRIFYIKRMYSLENWYTTNRFNTYSIKYTEDVLATGNTNSKDNQSDYITVVRTEGTKCINLNGYVGSQNINRTQSKNGITVTIGKMYIYMDYAILDLEVKNQTNNTIIIDTRENGQSMYLYDENRVKYTAFLNENSEEELKVRRNTQSKISIKFNKMYNPTGKDIYRICIRRYNIKL